MKALKEWKTYLKEANLSDEKKAEIVIDIIDAHARGPAPETTFANLDSLAEKINGISVSPNAVYIPGKNTIILDYRIWDDDFLQAIKDVLHEVEHANQEYRWSKFDARRRDMYLSGKERPPGVKFRKDVESLEWPVLSKFWNQVYDYIDAPHEVEAREYAERHYPNVMKKYFG